MALEDETVRPIDVTVVTRNGNGDIKATVVGLTIYAACIWYLFHPHEIEVIKAKIRSCLDRVIHKISIYTARSAIRSLPEIEE